MEKALKAVYDVHRQAVLDSNQSVTKFKALYERLTEKYKKLQKDHELLSQQNKHLQDAAFNQQTRGGDCCATLRSTLETIGTTYKQLLEEKDNRIKYLENEIKKHRRRSSAMGIGSLDFTQDTPLLSDAKTATPPSSKNIDKDTSPDSTSRGGNEETGSVTKKLSEKETVSCSSHQTGSLKRNAQDSETGLQANLQHSDQVEDEELVFVDKSETQSHQPKLRLQKGRLKRSRYTEDTSPENKRQRQSSSPKPVTQENQGACNAVIENIIPPVLVPDTCQPSLDETLARLNVDDAKRTEKANQKVNKVQKQKREKNTDKQYGKEHAIEFHGVQVVPETLAAFTDCDYSDNDNNYCTESNSGPNHEERTPLKDSGNNSMDVVSDTDESENEMSQCTVREKNKKITELSMRSILKSSDSQRNRSDRDGSKTGNLKDEKSKRKSEVVSGKVKAVDVSIRNILDSPDSQKHVSVLDGEGAADEFINHKTLNLSGESEVFKLDSDDDRDNNANVDKNLDDCSKKIESLGSNGKLDRNTNKKFRKDSIIEESEGSLNLRRSPRKLREVRYYNSPKKTKKRLKESSQLTESEIHEMFSSPNSSSNEETDKWDGYPVSKKPNSDNRTEEPESQSLDCYNIVPVQDGVPVSKKKIQLMVPRNRSKHKTNESEGFESELNKNQIPIDEADDKNAPDLKSPSIIATKPIFHDRVIEVLSSPSVNSLTDPESPLLLKGTSNNVPEDSNVKNKTNDDPDFGWRKTRDKTSRDKDLVDGQNKRLNNGSNDKEKTGQSPISKKKESSVGVRKSARVKPAKSLCQTTLTQSFFKSPSKKGQRSKVKDSDNNDDHDLQEAIRLSLEEAQNSQLEDEHLNDAEVEILDFGTEKENSPPFKRPNNLPRSSLRRRGTRNKQSVSPSDLDETVDPVKEKKSAQMLKEIVDNGELSQRSNSEGQRLNGSIDPAAELSELCAETSTLQSLPSLDKDFQFEELNQGRSLPKTSTLAEEDSQEIPSSSRSIKFGTKKKLKHVKKLKETEDLCSTPQGRQPDVGISLDVSFDHVPKKKEPEIAHVAVVRKRDERQKLKGHSCRECYEYYKSKGISEDEIQQHIQDCSRHRAKHVKPDTPPHFWSVGFIDTQECVDRGYLKIDNANQEKDVRTYRRRQPLEKRFKAKNETTLIESDGSDIDI